MVAVLFCFLTPSLFGQICPTASSVTPASPNAGDLIVLKLPKGLGYFDDTLDDVAIASHVVTITQSFDSEVNPPQIPIPDGAHLRCAALISDMGRLPAGDYTVKWVLHDTHWNRFTTLGDLQFSVVAVIPAIPSAAKPLLFASLAALGCLMMSARR
jgi:hypothetical protein